MTRHLFRYDHSMTDVLWLDGLEAEAWRSVVLLQTRLRAVLARGLLTETGLSESDYEVLVHLSEAPDRRLRQYELGRRTAWEKSRLSHHLRRMADRGLVESEGCETDNRGTFVLLTEAGWDAICQAAPAHVRLVRETLIDALSPEQLACLGTIGAQVTAVLNGSGVCDEVTPRDG
jgi:DNA-binding MarR family transcriptional regulator